MASAKNSPGPHDRKPGVPRATCQYFTGQGRKCRRPVGLGGKLCNGHKTMIERRAAGNPMTTPATPADSYRGGITTAEKKRATKIRSMASALTSAQEADRTRRPSPRSHHTSTGMLVITEQARSALKQMGMVIDPSSRVDPKQVLLDSVNSAWRQRQVWEAMLLAVPEEDWSEIGTIPVPGSRPSARGARIEVIQKYLTEATKVAARTSKLAIDAGIEERLVKLAEEQSALIADTVRAALLAAIGSLVKSGALTPASEAAAIDLALGSAASRLRVLASGGQGGPGSPGEIIEGIAREVQGDYSE